LEIFDITNKGAKSNEPRITPIGIGNPTNFYISNRWH